VRVPAAREPAGIDRGAPGSAAAPARAWAAGLACCRPARRGPAAGRPEPCSQPGTPAPCARSPHPGRGLRRGRPRERPRPSKRTGGAAQRCGAAARTHDLRALQSARRSRRVGGRHVRPLGVCLRRGGRLRRLRQQRTALAACALPGCARPGMRSGRPGAHLGAGPLVEEGEDALPGGRHGQSLCSRRLARLLLGSERHVGELLAAQQPAHACAVPAPCPDVWSQPWLAPAVCALSVLYLLSFESKVHLNQES